MRDFTHIEAPLGVCRVYFCNKLQKYLILGAKPHKLLGYPPIVLCDDPATPGGKLQALASIGHGDRLLAVAYGARVTLDGGLILAGTGNEDDAIDGVFVLYYNDPDNGASGWD
jgi:hypothetical protein